MKILNTSVSSWDFSWKNNVHIKNQETVVKSGSEDWERILVWVRVKPEIILDKHISWWFVVSNEVIRQYFDLNTTSISSSTSLKRHSAGRREKINNVNWRPLLLSPLLSSQYSGLNYSSQSWQCKLTLLLCSRSVSHYGHWARLSRDILFVFALLCPRQSRALQWCQEGGHFNC